MTAPQIAFIDLQAQRRRIGESIDKAVLRVVHHGKYIMGPEVAALEQELCSFTGAKHCISCSSGTDALLMPLMAKGIGPGDAIFVPAFTFAATVEVVALLGAIPVFVDVMTDNFNMSPESLGQAIAHAGSLNLRPAAVIPVDLFGQPANYNAFRPICDAHALFVIADAAQSFGASLDGQAVGTFGDVTATSFFPAKPLGCYGDGGAVFTDDDELAAAMRSIRVHGKGTHKYDNARIGLNARLDTLQAAILIEKLRIFPDELMKRQAVADRYSNALHNYCQTPRLANGATSAWAQYTLVLKDRQAMRDHLGEAGIPTAVYYPRPLNRQPAYRHCPTDPRGVPNAEFLAEHVLSLPMHPYLKEAESARIIDAVSACPSGG